MICKCLVVEAMGAGRVEMTVMTSRLHNSLQHRLVIQVRHPLLRRAQLAVTLMMISRFKR
jgi:hypothetical protein